MTLSSSGGESLLLVPAAVALVGAVLLALTASRSGLLGPGAMLTPEAMHLRRLGGVTMVGAAIAVLSRIRPTAASIGAAAGIIAMVAVLTLPASDVALDFDTWFDRDPDGASDATGDTGPTVVPLPPGASVEVRGGVVVIVLPDGSEQILPGGPGDLGDVEFETPDGGRFTPSGTPPDGRVVLIPAGGGGGGGGTERLQAPSTGVLALWLGYGVIALVLGGVLWLAFFPPRSLWHRPDSQDGGPTSPATDPPALDLAAAEAGLHASLAAMLRDPDPRTAIVGAYAVLLDALATAGARRRPEEAPHEHLDRVLGPLGVSPDPMHLLAGLFVLARFSPHEPTTAHRDDAIAALQGAIES